MWRETEKEGEKERERGWTDDWSLVELSLLSSFSTGECFLLLNNYAYVHKYFNPPISKFEHMFIKCIYTYLYVNVILLYYSLVSLR